ncbi:segregation/condensation protein A [bacterium]|nr:segregation/condensation protein A [bacterium]
MTNDCTFTLPVFQGPLDLLLHLIKVNELEITEISIKQITGQYLDYLRLMETLDLEVAGDYLVMAASLINIKLRNLLPDAEEELEPEEEEVDNFLTARALMQRLIEYRKFKEAATSLGTRAERQSQIFIREVALPQLAEAESAPQIRGDLTLLLEAFTRVIKFVERRDYHRIEQESYTIEDKIDMVRRRLLLEEGFDLGEVFLECHDKVEMIITLLAMLELCRLKEVTIRQGDIFGDVRVDRRSAVSTPDEQEEAEREAEQLKELEKEIVAARTHFVDDGIIPDDDAEPELPTGAQIIEISPEQTENA